MISTTDHIRVYIHTQNVKGYCIASVTKADGYSQAFGIMSEAACKHVATHASNPIP